MPKRIVLDPAYIAKVKKEDSNVQKDVSCMERKKFLANTARLEP